MNIRVVGRPLVLVVAAALASAVGGAVALGAWAIPSTPTKLSGQAGEMPGGPTPTASRVPKGIAVSWTAAALSDSANATYDVTRHPDKGIDQLVCSVEQTSCLDTGVKPGSSYTYTVRVVRGRWAGPDGRPSKVIMIDGKITTPPAQTASEPTQPAAAEVPQIPSEAGATQPQPTTAPTPTAPAPIGIPPAIESPASSPPSTTGDSSTPTATGP
jgi:hypothetical protein